jgi:uncharacterized circularly permuted ATP-grasp superfamily protein
MIKLTNFETFYHILPDLFHLLFKCPIQYYFTYILDDLIRFID